MPVEDMLRLCTNAVPTRLREALSRYAKRPAGLPPTTRMLIFCLRFLNWCRNFNPSRVGRSIDPRQNLGNTASMKIDICETNNGRCAQPVARCSAPPARRRSVARRKGLPYLEWDTPNQLPWRRNAHRHSINRTSLKVEMWSR
ncbi:hypothetical protein J2X19_003990 [Rhodoferax ferrireducens]|uniref:Uncharacterized protein n=1 Tax=Rhodoferax ferrireducens TaxID=192843 RepID=A0ABU2CD96_9BURK|nr:hypothetical protein [Rhodoferax ferrireducens]